MDGQSDGTAAPLHDLAAAVPWGESEAHEAAGRAKAHAQDTFDHRKFVAKVIGRSMETGHPGRLPGLVPTASRQRGTRGDASPRFMPVAGVPVFAATPNGATVAHMVTRLHIMLSCLPAACSRETHGLQL